MLKTPKEKLFSKLYLNGTNIDASVKLNDINPNPHEKIIPASGSTTFKIERINTDIGNSNIMAELEKQFAESFIKSIEKGFDKFINELNEELNVSRKCAEYYAIKYFNFRIETVNEGTEDIKLLLIPFWKPPEQILEEIDKVKDIKCEKELLYRNHGD